MNMSFELDNKSFFLSKLLYHIRYKWAMKIRGIFLSSTQLSTVKIKAEIMQIIC